LGTNNIPPLPASTSENDFHVGKMRTTQVHRNLGGCHSGLEDGQQVLSGMSRDRTYTTRENGCLTLTREGTKMVQRDKGDYVCHVLTYLSI